MWSFVYHRLYFCPFSFGYCVVCPSIYGFWLPRLLSLNFSALGWCYQSMMFPLSNTWDCKLVIAITVPIFGKLFDKSQYSSFCTFIHVYCQWKQYGYHNTVNEIYEQLFYVTTWTSFLLDFISSITWMKRCFILE